MKMFYQVEGILLKKEDLGEHDERLEFLTDAAGLLSLKARGSKHLRSKLAPWLKIFSVNELLVVSTRHSRLDLLIALEPVWQGERLYQAFGRLGAAYYCSELVEKVLWPLRAGPWWQAPEQAADASSYFHLLKRSLVWLEKTDESSLQKKLAAVLTWFELKVLELAGFGLSFEHCSACGQALPASGFVFFNERGGGILCWQCGRQRHGSTLLPAQEVAALGRLSLEKAPRFKGNTLRTLRQLLPKFLEYILGQEIHAKQYLALPSKGWGFSVL